MNEEKMNTNPNQENINHCECGGNCGCDGNCECHCEHDDEASSTNNKNEIHLPVSNGEVFIVDADSLDWDSMVENINELRENVNMVRQMLYYITAVTGTNTNSLTPQQVTDNLTSFVNDFGIRLEYTNAELSEREIAMLMCFDTIGILEIFIKHAEMYQMMNDQTKITNSLIEQLFHNPEELNSSGLTNFCESLGDTCDDNENNTVFKVLMKYDDERITDAQVEKTDDYPLDEIDIPDEEDGNISIFVCAKNSEEAKEKALDIICEEGE
jgi:hypothetical protein